MVQPAWGRSFAVSGKVPQRNTRRASGKPISRLRETLATVARPCSAEGYESRRDGRLKHAETPAVRERPPRKWPWLAQTGLSRRSLPGSFLAGRRGCPEGPRRHPPQASRVSCTALRVCSPSRGPVFSRQGFRLRQFPRTQLVEYRLWQAEGLRARPLHIRQSSLVGPECPQNPSPSPAALCGHNRGPANRQGRHRGGDGFHPRLHSIIS